MGIHVAKKESSSKTFRPRGSSSVTKLPVYLFVQFLYLKNLILLGHVNKLLHIIIM